MAAFVSWRLSSSFNSRAIVSRYSSTTTMLDGGSIKRRGMGTTINSFKLRLPLFNLWFLLIHAILYSEYVLYNPKHNAGTTASGKAEGSTDTYSPGPLFILRANRFGHEGRIYPGYRAESTSISGHSTMGYLIVHILQSLFSPAGLLKVHRSPDLIITRGILLTKEHLTKYGST